MANHRLAADKRARIIALAEAGKGRNEIATEVGCGLATVSRCVKEAGLSFDRTATKHATAARKADSASRRADIAAQLLDHAQALLTEINSTEYLVFNFGGKDNTYAERVLSSVPADTKKSLMTTASVALQRHMDLEKHDAAEKTSANRSMLTELGKAFGIAPADSL